jgi:hypothetical protein
MPGWLKIVLAVVAVFVLVAIGFAVTGYLYVKQHKEEWLQAGNAAKKEGEAFAAGKDAAQCVDEAVSRVGKCQGLPCEIGVRLFLDSCTAKAAPAPQLCTNIPPRSEIMRSARWALDECRRRGLPNSQPCGRLLQEVQRYCANQK